MKDVNDKDEITNREKMYTFNQTLLILQVDIMLLSLVIVAVEITSFTVACFFIFSCDSIVFLLQHKIITRQTKKET